MARATCPGCGTAVFWHAGRGRRLAELRCPQGCPDPLRGPTAGQASPLQGRAAVPCEVDGCERSSRTPRRPVLPFTVDRAPRVYGSGTPVCGRHDLVRMDLGAQVQRLLVATREQVYALACEGLPYHQAPAADVLGVAEDHVLGELASAACSPSWAAEDLALGPVRLVAARDGVLDLLERTRPRDPAGRVVALLERAICDMRVMF